MSQDPKIAQPKVADTAMFGDDAWFLSGLGISFDQPAKVVVKAEPEDTIEEEVHTLVTEPEDTSSTESASRHKEDIEPTIKEARIISK